MSLLAFFRALVFGWGLALFYSSWALSQRLENFFVRAEELKFGWQMYFGILSTLWACRCTRQCVGSCSTKCPVFNSYLLSSSVWRKTGNSVKTSAASEISNLTTGLWNPEPSRTVMWLIMRQWHVCISLCASISYLWANLMLIDVFWKFWSIPAWINFPSCQSIMTQLLRRRWFDWQQED